jgi:nucleolar pre-ribosomal-associated protein 1
LKPQIEQILLQLMEEMYYTNSKDQNSSLKILIASLECKGFIRPDAVFSFIDNCAARFSRKPIKYWDDLAGLIGDDPSSDRISITPFFTTILEQWPFVLVSTSEKITHRDIATWISRFIGFTASVEQNDSVLRVIRDRLIDTVEDGKLKKIFKQALKHNYSLSTETSSKVESEDIIEPLELSPPSAKDSHTILSNLLQKPQSTDVSKALTRWASKDIDEAIEDDHLSNLILCLCSTDATARKQGFVNISTFKSTLETSSYAEKEPLGLLLNELLYTADTLIAESPCPTYLAAFAARGIQILHNPQHTLYTKFNEFLQDGPKWDEQKIPLLHSILLQPPTNDDDNNINPPSNSYTSELTWLLDYLLESLHTPRDMDTFRIRNVFERLLTLYTAPSTASATCNAQILALVARASTIEGASTTLITRSGILSWIEMVVALAGNDDDEDAPQKEVWMAVRTRLLETCDRARVESWMGRDGERLVDELAAFTVS